MNKKDELVRVRNSAAPKVKVGKAKTKSETSISEPV
jgi:hypothetical protein